MKEIFLTKGQIALVDDEDYERFIQHKWYAVERYGRWYAVTQMPRNGKKKDIRRFMGSFILNKTSNKNINYVNGNSLDNRKNNVRLATMSQSGMNKKNIEHSSVYKGVSYIKGKRTQPWRATIQIDKIKMSLGVYSSEDEAAEAYQQTAKRYFGEFARF
jgi:hypothetical protein